MSFKRRLKAGIDVALSRIYRLGFKPLLRLMPLRYQERIVTLAHYAKLTMFHGYVEPFVPAAIRGLPLEPSVQLDDGAGSMPSRGPLSEADSIVPAWAVDELKALAAIEAPLYPTQEFLARFHTWSVPVETLPGEVFFECHDALVGSEPDVIFVVPWLKRGGADLGIVHHVNHCVAGGLKAVVVTTLDEESPWLSRLPWKAKAIEFGRLAHSLSKEDRCLVLVRLLLQSHAKTIHIVNSQLGWEVLQAYGRSLKASGKRVFASLFSDGLGQDGVPLGYAANYLPYTYCWLDGVLSDNRAFLNVLKSRYGVPEEMLHLVYFPTRFGQSALYGGTVKGGRVLWASRIAQEKLPEVLLEVARRAPEIKIDVYGEAYGTAEESLVKALQQLPNVRLLGRYEAFEQIVAPNRYSLFLYTSAYDGLPNVLLEAVAAGLPVVAPDVGGVSELIDDTTGYLVRDAHDPDDYLARIEEALGDPDERRARWERAWQRLQERHSFAAFHRTMASIPGYGHALAESAPCTDKVLRINGH